MVKQYKKRSMSNKKSKSNKSHKSHKSRKSYKSMKGGDDGRFGMPPAFYGNGTKGYFESGSSELNSNGKQHAVSQGTISADGFTAGPNLFPMKGGNCGCKKQKKSKTNKSFSKSHKNCKTSKKSKKNMKSKKH
jgi:hypothetical protein